MYDGLGVASAAGAFTAPVSVFATSPIRLQAVTGVGLGVAGAAVVTAGDGAAAAAATGAAAGVVEASPAGVVVTGSTPVGVIAARRPARERSAQRKGRMLTRGHVNHAPGMAATAGSGAAAAGVTGGAVAAAAALAAERVRRPAFKSRRLAELRCVTRTEGCRHSGHRSRGGGRDSQRRGPGCVAAAA